MSGADLARRATADPLLRLLAHGFATTYRRPPEAVWRAPYAFRAGTPAVPSAAPATAGPPWAGWCAAAGHYVDVAVAPRADGVLRCASLNHPAEAAELPLTGPAGRAPDWAARPYAALRALAAAGCARGGADLHLNAPLPEAVGLPVAEPLECAVALAVADAHAGRGPGAPSRNRLAALLDAAVPGDDGLRRAVLFARAGHLLAPDGSTHRPLYALDGAPDPCLLLLTARLPAGTDPDPGDSTAAAPAAPAAGAAGLAAAARAALDAGARSAWWPGARPGRGVLLLLPTHRRAAVRAAAVASFRRRDLPVPRVLRITLAAAARREG
ncbi:galactokinase [Streptomyces angustmyceticus]|uniref:galactokinase n=1 Tax=Streptomyces angustmyceticus TaxID=285578 RepID=UPI0036920AB3